MTSFRNTGSCLLTLLLSLAHPIPAHANCNVIPGARDSFRGAVGKTDRPFAMPGDVVSVAVEPGICDRASIAFADQPGGSTPADDYLVTLVFTPPQGPRNAVVIATDCSQLQPASPAIAACNAALGAGGTATCVQANTVANPNALTISDALHLSFRFPDTDDREGAANDDRTLAGPAKIAVSRASDGLPCQIATQRCAAQTLLAACVDELYQQDGTCRTGINDVDATFGHFTALPPPNDFSALVSAPGSTEARFTIDKAGNALVPMDWQAVLVRQGAVPFPRLVRSGSSVDSFLALGGNNVIQIPNAHFIGSYAPEGLPLPPVFQPISDPSLASEATLFGSVDAPLGVIRVARRLPVVASCTGGANNGAACEVVTDCPGGACMDLASFEYRQCQLAPSRPCREDVDCGGGVCGAAVCWTNGAATATPCTTDANCTAPGSQCGPGLFDFADRFDPGIGPVLLGPGLYSAQQQSPVSLESQRQTLDLFAFVVPEALDAVDRNGDGDATDFAVTLRDRSTGLVQNTGLGGSVGRPTGPVRFVPPTPTRYTQDPFCWFFGTCVPANPVRPRFASLATEGEFAAFLRSEPAQGPCATPLACDESGDGDATDGLLTVLRVGASPAYLTPALPADAAPRIGSQNVAISDGLVFFRTAEADRATRSTVLISKSSAGVLGNGPVGTYPAISANGRFVAFTSTASNLVTVPADTNGVEDVFLHDRDTDADGFYDEIGTISTKRLSLTTASVQMAGLSGLDGAVTITPDGRYVGFNTANAFFGNDSNGLYDSYLRDNTTNATNLVSGLANGISANGVSARPPSISANGRFIAFQSTSTNLVAGDTNGVSDIFVRDRDADKDGIYDEINAVSVTRVSVASTGTQSNGSGAELAEVSDDGRHVAFVTDADNLVTGDTNGVWDVFVRDRDPDRDGIFDETFDATTTRVSVSTSGAQGNGLSGTWPMQYLSADGRFVQFSSVATNLVAGDTNGVSDIFVRDRDADGNGVMDEPGGVQTQRVNVASNGAQATGGSSGGAALSDDGRYHAFAAPGSLDGGSGYGTFVHDLVAGTTQRVSLSDVGASGLSSSYGVLAAGAGHIAFTTTSNLAAGASGSNLKLFVRGILTASCTPDLNGDCDRADTVLGVLDVRNGATSPTWLAAAEQVEVRNGNAVYLSSESSDVNGDGDSSDQIVNLYRNRIGSQGFAVAGRQPRITNDVFGFLSYERDYSPLYDINGDGDFDDEVGFLHRNGPYDGYYLPTGTADSFDVVNTNDGTGVAVYDAAEDVAAVMTPEANNAGIDRNADGDARDRTIGVVVYDIPASGYWASYFYTPIDAQSRYQPALDFVLGPEVVAFRTREAHFCSSNVFAVTLANCTAPPGCSGVAQCDKNGDGDCCDDVLQAYDVVEGVASGAAAGLHNSGRTVLPCTFASCDSSEPYKVVGRTVRFLENEAQQGNDLNGDGDAIDIVVQVFKLATGVVQTAGAAVADDPNASAQGPNPLDPIDAGSDEAGSSGGSVFVASGRCIETTAQACATDAQCDNGAICATSFCRRDHGTCASAADCPPGVVAACTASGSYTAGAADTDADSILDPFDDCPRVADPGQLDADGDGVGNACDLETCGNALREATEECDDGNPLSGDGCSSACRIEGGPCDDGTDNDSDGLVDFGADPGCASRGSLKENPKCDDNLDNDGDGKIDWNGPGPIDPQCAGKPTRDGESPNCGLGAELALFFVGFGYWRRRIRGSGQRERNQRVA